MLYVKEIIRPKYALKDNTQLPSQGQKGVEIASMPSMPIDKYIADATLLAEILLQKYEYHVPFAYSGGYPFSISGDIRSLPSWYSVSLAKLILLS